MNSRRPGRWKLQTFGQPGGCCFDVALFCSQKSASRPFVAKRKVNFFHITIGNHAKVEQRQQQKREVSIRLKQRDFLIMRRQVNAMRHHRQIYCIGSGPFSLIAVVVVAFIVTTFIWQLAGASSSILVSLYSSNIIIDSNCIITTPLLLWLISVPQVDRN